MTINEMLIKRLQESGVHLPEGAQFIPVTSSEARSHGWSWHAIGPDGRELNIGSRHSVTELLQSDIFFVSREAKKTDISISHKKPCQRCGIAASVSSRCRICRTPFCGNCFIDHHHEGYGTPSSQTW